MDGRDRHKVLGLRTLDWMARPRKIGPWTRLVWPVPMEEERTPLYRWLQGLEKGGELLVYAPRTEGLLCWWEELPRYMNWAMDLEQRPRMGLLAVVRTAADMARVKELRQSAFPMRRLVIQAFPEEHLDLSTPCDALWVGAEGAEWNTSYVMREEWIRGLLKQAGAAGIPAAFRGWCGWWPERFGGHEWGRRGGYIRGPGQGPEIDAELAGTYPSWVVKDRRSCLRNS